MYVIDAGTVWEDGQPVTECGFGIILSDEALSKDKTKHIAFTKIPNSSNFSNGSYS